MGRNFLVQRDKGTAVSPLYRDKGTMGQKSLHCSGTKGQRDKLKILQRDGTGQDRLLKSGMGCETGQDFDSLSRPVLLEKTGQSRKGHSRTEKHSSKTENNVLKQEN